jgi:peptide/nickel transport system permease protein
LPATSYVPFTEDPWLWFKHLILPWVTLGLASAAVITRQLRSSLIGVLGQDYVRTARAKGLRGRSVVLKHASKNAAIPVVTVLGTQVAFVLGGSVIVEQVFGIAGVGQLAVTSVLKRDLPIIQGVVVMTTLFVLFANLLVDIAYGYLNPKVRVR